jgi:hypothetical protein
VRCSGVRDRMRSISFFFSVLILIAILILFARASPTFHQISSGCHLVTLSRTVLPLASLGGNVLSTRVLRSRHQTLFAFARQRSSTLHYFRSLGIHLSVVLSSGTEGMRVYSNSACAVPSRVEAEPAVSMNITSCCGLEAHLPTMDLAGSSQVAFVPLPFLPGAAGVLQDKATVGEMRLRLVRDPGSSAVDAVVAATRSVPFPVREGQSTCVGTASLPVIALSPCAAVLRGLASGLLSF